jgi:hypothetical protein
LGVEDERHAELVFGVVVAVVLAGDVVGALSYFGAEHAGVVAGEDGGFGVARGVVDRREMSGVEDGGFVPSGEGAFGADLVDGCGSALNVAGCEAASLDFGSAVGKIALGVLEVGGALGNLGAVIMTWVAGDRAQKSCCRDEGSSEMHCVFR